MKRYQITNNKKLNNLPRRRNTPGDSQQQKGASPG